MSTLSRNCSMSFFGTGFVNKSLMLAAELVNKTRRMSCRTADLIQCSLASTCLERVCCTGEQAMLMDALLSHKIVHGTHATASTPRSNTSFLHQTAN